MGRSGKVLLAPAAQPLLFPSRPSESAYSSSGLPESRVGEGEALLPTSNRLVLPLVLSLSFAMGIEYGILMPTVWQYVQLVGGSRKDLGFALAAFSFSRTLFFGVMGRWSDKRPMMESFVACFAIGVVGNIMYGMAGDLNSLALLITGRLVAGVGAANTTLSQAYIARALPPSRRTASIALSQGLSLVGILAGPALSLIFEHTHFTLRFSEHHALVFDTLTAAGYSMALMNLLLFLLFLVLFKEPPTVAHLEEAPIEPSMAPLRTVLIDRGGWFCLYVAFLVGFEITALETSLTPLTEAEYGWGTRENSYLFSTICAVAIAGTVSTVVLDRRFHIASRWILVIALVSMLVGFVFGFVFGGKHIPLFGLTLFGVPFTYGIIVMTSPNIAVYSSMVGTLNKGQFMSLTQTVMGTSRILGPLFAGLAMHWGAIWHVVMVLFIVYIPAPFLLFRMWPKFVIS